MRKTLCVVSKFPPTVGGVSINAAYAFEHLGKLGWEIHVFSHIGLENLHGEDSKELLSTATIVGKLVEKARNVASAESCKVIIGWYLYPFGVAAHALATIYK